MSTVASLTRDLLQLAGLDAGEVLDGEAYKGTKQAVDVQPCLVVACMHASKAA